MRIVNELVFGRKLPVRPPWEDGILFDTLANELRKPENERLLQDVKRLRNAGLKNVGEKGAAEILFAIAIFLAQVPETAVDHLEYARLRRYSEFR